MAYITGEMRKDVELQLMERAFSDAAFKKELLENPRAAIEKEIGIRLPATANVKVLEETEDNVFFVLPPQAKRQSKELSDEELEAVAGGKGDEPAPQPTATAVAGVRG